jgi:hypothetical protein
MRMRWSAIPLSLSLALVCSACTIYIGPYDGTDEPAPGRPSVLPEPEGTDEDEPALDEAQRARKEEAERYTAEVVYQGAEILETVQ